VLVVFLAVRRRHTHSTVCYATPVGEVSYGVNLARIHLPWQNHFIALSCGSQFSDQAGGLYCGNRAMIHIIMTDPHRLVIRDTHMDADNGALSGAFQLPQPLVGNIKMRSNRHQKDPLGDIPR
jgi:hypothetical protein